MMPWNSLPIVLASERGRFGDLDLVNDRGVRDVDTLTWLAPRLAT